MNQMKMTKQGLGDKLPIFLMKLFYILHSQLNTYHPLGGYREY